MDLMLLKRGTSAQSPQQIRRDQAKEEIGMDPTYSEENIFSALAQDTWKEIQEFYLPGTTNYIKKHYNDLYNEITGMQKRLNDLSTLSTTEGKDTVEQFKETLMVWKTLHQRAVELYRRQKDRWEEKQGSLF